MTLLITHPALQQYWWIIISLLASFLVFLLFVQGGQSMIFTLPENEKQRTLLVNALGRKWEFTFTTLVVFGGTFFASFPLFYSTSFGGAYWIWITILFSFTIQAVSYEYRTKAGNFLGQKTFEIFLLINGSLGPFLIGTAVGTFFTGSMFSLNDMNNVTWQTPWYGLEALANFRNISLGFSVLFLARLNGLLFIINTIDDQSMRKRAARRIIINLAVFLIFFLYFVVTLLISVGYAYDSSTGLVSVVKNKYLNNFIEMPFVSVLFILGVAGVLAGLIITLLKNSVKGIWFSGVGTILAVLALFFVSGFNGTSFYPSVFDLQSSLTLSNASSSPFTLKTMMFFSFMTPVVLAYIWYAWKSISNSRITENEMQSDVHKY
jgi:cytochrome d ubiquinol oxidase subunit II